MRQIQDSRCHGRQLRSLQVKSSAEGKLLLDPTAIDCFSILEFFIRKALMSFPDGFSAYLDSILPPRFERFDCRVERAICTECPRALTNLVKKNLEGKTPIELRPFFLGAKLIALKTTGEEIVISL